MISWYECDGRGHYDPVDAEIALGFPEPEAHIEGFLPEPRVYIGPERRSELPREYVCSRCASEMYGEECYVCGGQCRRKEAA